MGKLTHSQWRTGLRALEATARRYTQWQKNKKTFCNSTFCPLCQEYRMPYCLQCPYAIMYDKRCTDVGTEVPIHIEDENLDTIKHKAYARQKWIREVAIPDWKNGNLNYLFHFGEENE